MATENGLHAQAPPDASPLGEGGELALNGLNTVESAGRKPVAIIGGTGYVGRLLARRLLSHPTFCLGPIVGSSMSEGLMYKDVWERKEAALLKNYGSQLWSAMEFPPELEGVRVSSLDALLASDCKFAVSCVAPDVGYVEDILVSNGVKVFSISPYKRMDNLMVLEINPEQLVKKIDFPLFKSPNCVSVGTSLALKAISDAYGITEASVCTFQSLSGRGDAMYPRELVHGNVYPVWGTKENTETWIHNEIAALIKMAPGTLSVRANRVGVHIGHFVDVRVKVRDRKKLQSLTPDDVYQMFEAFAPMEDLAPHLPSLPPRPISVQREVGTPRPASHNMEYGGMQVAVGNLKLNDGVWDVLFSVVVNNMVRGAYGAALLMAEYYDYLKSNPEALAAATERASSTPVPGRPRAIGSEAESEDAAEEEEDEPVEVPVPVSHALTTKDTFAAAASAFKSNPGAAHGAVAMEELHWYHPDKNAWLTWDTASGAWSGWDAATGAAFALPTADSWTPWTTPFDDSRAPYYSWFVGGQTNAAFNESDRHVLSGHGKEKAFVSVTKAAYQANVTRPGALAGACTSITRRELLFQSVVGAQVLKEIGVEPGDRVILLMPHCIEQMVWMQAIKRLGALYVSLPDNISLKALGDRMNDSGARLVLTTSAMSTHGMSLRSMVLRAIGELVPMSMVLDVVREQLVAAAEAKLGSGRLGLKNAPAEVCEALKQTFLNDSTVDLKAVTSKLEMAFSLDPKLRAAASEIAGELQDRVYREFVATSAKRVLVVGSLDNPSGGGESNGMAGSSSWHDLASAAPPSAAPSAAPVAAFATLMLPKLWADAEAALLQAADIKSVALLMELPDTQLVAALWKLCLPLPLPSTRPYFIIYTSGTSGFRPRGLVSDTGGYCSGLARTMRLAFDVRPGDIVLVNASPSWITGQSYGVTAPLITRCTSVLVPSADQLGDELPGFFAAVVKQLGVTIFKASASYFRRIARHRRKLKWLRQQKLSTSLRVATSCGEPLNAELHGIMARAICPNFINSYWSTEHGAICLSQPYGNKDEPLRRDAHMSPMPWVEAAVWLPLEQKLPYKYRVATPVSSELGGASEKGRLVVTQPWPAMAKTIWGNADDFGADEWVGDLKQFDAVYWSSFVDDDGTTVPAFDLGDLGRCWPDGSLTVVGRSPEVIKVNGVNIGAAEVEGAILKDRQIKSRSPVLDCLVVGVDVDGGMVPVALIILQLDHLLTEELVARLKQLVHTEHGDAWVPSDMLRVNAIPRTHNGKAMRQVVQRLFAGKFPGDVSEMSNPECLHDLKSSIAEWREGQKASYTLDSGLDG